MKWISEDIEMFLKAREYVDTIVLPLFPLSFDEKMQQTASMTEFIRLLSLQLERKFKGRLILLPGFTYLKSSGMDELEEQLGKWEKAFFENGFKHVYFLTSDIDCRKIENRVKGTLVWMPTVPLSQMDEQAKNTVLEDQVAQLVEIFVQNWKNEE